MHEMGRIVHEGDGQDNAGNWQKKSMIVQKTSRILQNITKGEQDSVKNDEGSAGMRNTVQDSAANWKESAGNG